MYADSDKKKPIITILADPSLPIKTRVKHTHKLHTLNIFVLHRNLWKHTQNLI